MNIQTTLIIGEGPTDEYMLKPIIKKMMKAVGKPHTTIKFEPVGRRSGGVSQILKNQTRVEQIIQNNSYFVDLFIICVDRDGLDGQNGRKDRPAQLRSLEQRVKDSLKANQELVSVCAIEEIEVWILAGHNWKQNFPNWQWQDIRGEHNPKETYYQPFAEERGLWQQAPGQGRKRLAQEVAYVGVKGKCQEIVDLEKRIIRFLERTD